MPSDKAKGPSPPKKAKTSNGYAKSYPRITKENLYMIIALWMEDFDDDPTEGYNKVGAVLVLPNDVIFAADCSRDGVHAAARLLMKHYDKAKGCKMFMSRKPCPICAKLLVQSKVERVLFLPFEPEYYRWPIYDTRRVINEINKYNQTKMKQVDMLFTASPIAQTKFVLQVEEPVVEREKIPEEKHEEVSRKKEALTDRYRALDKDSEWMECIQVELPWPALDDEMKKQVQEYFEKVIDWIARVLVLRGKGLDCGFKHCEFSKPPTAFDPVNNSTHKEQARHFMTIAHFLSQRTDDPKKTGVGVVIVSSTTPTEILAFGWNGFPLKAQYGEFARGSDEPVDKKYPYVIHAEQNALLFRNKKKIKDAILFVTKTPCNECTPLIAMQGIETVVVDDDVISSACKQQKNNGLGYNKFLEKVEEGKFVCFHIKKPVDVDA
jgi:dCMP deaminase